MSDLEIVITAPAAQTMADMRRNVDRVGKVFGDESKEYTEIMASLVSAYENIFRLGGRISRDGDLSLYGVSFIHYGVIFFAHKETRCPACWAQWPYGVHVRANTNPSCERCAGTGNVTVTGDDVTNGVAIPGTWSIHS